MIVRPERISVTRAGNNGVGGSSWEGTVVERTFLGAVTRLTIRVGDETLLADLAGEATSDIRFAIDDRVAISFEPGGCRLIPASAAPVELVAG
jgi:hypothetical protein